MSLLPKPLIAASIKPFILSLLKDHPSYGYELIQRVHDLTKGQIHYTTSTLYPVLHSLENQGFVTCFWQVSDAGPRRKYYQLTTKGKKALEKEKQQWLDVHAALMELWGPIPAID